MQNNYEVRSFLADNRPQSKKNTDICKKFVLICRGKTLR